MRETVIAKVEYEVIDWNERGHPTLFEIEIHYNPQNVKHAVFEVDTLPEAYDMLPKEWQDTSKWTEVREEALQGK